MFLNAPKVSVHDVCFSFLVFIAAKLQRLRVHTPSNSQELTALCYLASLLIKVCIIGETGFFLIKKKITCQNQIIFSDTEKPKANGFERGSPIKRSTGAIRNKPRISTKPTSPNKGWRPPTPISIPNLPKYIKQRKADGDKGFTRDYEVWTTIFSSLVEKQSARRFYLHFW